MAEATAHRTFAYLESDDCVLYAHLGSVLIACTRDHEDEEHFRLLEWNLRAVAASNGGNVGILFLVDHSKGPAPRFAENAKRIMDRNARVIVGVSTVLLADGFVASLYRSVGAAIVRMVGQVGRIGVHGTVEDGARWIVARMPPGPGTPTASALTTAAYATLRSHRAPRRIS